MFTGILLVLKRIDPVYLKLLFLQSDQSVHAGKDPPGQLLKSLIQTLNGGCYKFKEL